jgi:hypothetical protein
MSYDPSLVRSVECVMMFMAFCLSIACIHSVFASCSEHSIFVTTPSSLPRSIKVVEPREASPSSQNDKSIHEINGRV